MRLGEAQAHRVRHGVGARHERAAERAFDEAALAVALKPLCGLRLGAVGALHSAVAALPQVLHTLAKAKLRVASELGVWASNEQLFDRRFHRAVDFGPLIGVDHEVMQCPCSLERKNCGLLLPIEIVGLTF